MQKFKDLFEKLLTEYLEEMGVSAEKFSASLMKQADKPEVAALLERILAVDDFLSNSACNTSNKFQVSRR